MLFLQLHAAMKELKCPHDMNKRGAWARLRGLSDTLARGFSDPAQNPTVSQAKVPTVRTDSVHCKSLEDH